MKKVKMLVCVLLAAMLCLSTVACKKENKDLKDSSVLNIVMPDLGYGTDWMTGVAAGYTAKTGTKVNVDVTPTESSYVNSMRAGTAQYDIYVLRGNTYDLVANNAANVSGYDCILAELDDVYDSYPDGNGIKFKDKMNDVYEIYNRVDAKGNGDYHYYGVQWCDSIFSLVRNLKVWQSDWKVPNTTNELLALASQIKKAGKTPFIWSNKASYWWATANLWVTQYQGLEDMYGDKGFFNGYDENGNANRPEMWNRTGILESLRVLDELVNEKNGYQHVLSTQVDFTSAQGYFLTETSGIAMMSNGDWLYNEMKKNYSRAEIDMIKTPVVSAIAKHPDCENTIDNDEELSALIAAIDENGSQTPKKGKGYDVSQKALEKVYEARTMYTCASNINHVMVAPSYSDSLVQVKDFFKYLASDEGLKLFTQYSGGFTLCFDSSDEVLAISEQYSNDFVKCTESIKRGNQVAPWPIYSSRLFSVGGMPIYPTIETGYNFPELIFSLGKGYIDADTLYGKNYNNAKLKWSVYLQNAGING